MNYTKNYHLPQWIKEDRVLMEDFNAAMADIESGLTQNAQTAAAANSKTAGDAASATAAAETRALARLRKLGYDLSQVNGKLLASGAAAGRAKCLVFNGLSTPEEKSRAGGFRCAPDRQGAQLGPQTMLNLERLTSEISSCITSPRVGNEVHASQTVDFHSSQTGTITQLSVWVRNRDYIAPPTVKLECLDLGTNSQVYSVARKELELQKQEYGTQLIDVSIPLEAGHTYRLKISIIISAYAEGIGFGEENHPAFAGSVSSPMLSSGTIQESLVLDSSARIAVAVVHYSGGDSAPVVSVGSRNLTAQFTRQGTDIRGQTCTEREYYLESTWSGTVPLAVSCQSSAQDLTVYDVEFCLI